MKKRLLACALCLALGGSLLAGCSGSQISSQTTDLMKGLDAQPLTAQALDAETGSLAVTEFSVKLFQEAVTEGESTLISPLSVISALAMTANGARENTLAQMEEVFGLSIQDLNQYLQAYTQALPQGETYRLDIANSIWLKDDETFVPNEEFLQTNAQWYNAGVYQAPFDDSTVQDINAWVKENTDGLIPTILDQIPTDAVMYLLNALVFDAEWQSPYYDFQVREGTFTTEEGKQRQVEMMYNDEWGYLEDENATGFLKNYADGSYAFVALLPREGVPLQDYVDSLTGEGLRSLLANAQAVTVETAIPKFQTEYSAALNDILEVMGMADAFDPKQADLSGLGGSASGNNLYISRVLHKTFINVDEKGTQAGAATLVEVAEESAALIEEIKTVHLDRPFFYMIVDREAGLPIFMGTVTDIET